MAFDPVPDTGTHANQVIRVIPRGDSADRFPPSRRAIGLACACLILFFLVGLPPSLTAAHWIDPAAIVASLAGDSSLREAVGVERVERRERLLVIAVDRLRWEKVAEEERLRLADDWRMTWRHNVNGGVVAVVDVTDEAPLINYDGRGKARIIRD